MNLKKEKKAFTLSEMLVALGLIGILVVVAITLNNPAAQRYRVAQTQLTQTDTALNSWSKAELAMNEKGLGVTDKITNTDTLVSEIQTYFNTKQNTDNNISVNFAGNDENGYTNITLSNGTTLSVKYIYEDDSVNVDNDQYDSNIYSSPIANIIAKSTTTQSGKAVANEEYLLYGSGEIKDITEVLADADYVTVIYQITPAANKSGVKKDTDTNTVEDKSSTVDSDTSDNPDVIDNSDSVAPVYVYCDKGVTDCATLCSTNPEAVGCHTVTTPDTPVCDEDNKCGKIGIKDNETIPCEAGYTGNKIVQYVITSNGKEYTQEINHCCPGKQIWTDGIGCSCDDAEADKGYEVIEDKTQNCQSPCPAGTYSAGGKEAVCQLCDSGEYCPEAKMAVFKTCPEGSYCPDKTVTENGEPTCSTDGSCEVNICVAGTDLQCAVTSKPKQTSTYTKRKYVFNEDNKLEETKSGGLIKSVKCPSGYYCPACSTDDTGCVYDKDNKTEEETNLNSRKSPIICPAGSYCEGEGLKEATLCPAGTYNPKTGATSIDDCIACPKGTKCPETGMTAPISCECGTYQDKEGQTTCNTLDAGYVHKFDANNTEKDEQGNRIRAIGADPCPAGYTCPGGCPGNATICPKGTYQKDNKCVVCETGTYQNQPGQTSCKPCPSNSTTAEKGAESITECKCKAGFDLKDKFDETAKICAALFAENKDANEQPNACTQTAKGNYSPNLDNCYYACSDILGEHSTTEKAGSTSSDDCKCDEKYYLGTDVNDGSKHCVSTECAHYSSIDNEQHACPADTYLQRGTGITEDDCTSLAKNEVFNETAHCTARICEGNYIPNANKDDCICGLECSTKKVADAECKTCICKNDISDCTLSNNPANMGNKDKYNNFKFDDECNCTCNTASSDYMLYAANKTTMSWNSTKCTVSCTNSNKVLKNNQCVCQNSCSADQTLDDNCNCVTKPTPTPTPDVSCPAGQHLVITGYQIPVDKLYSYFDYEKVTEITSSNIISVENYNANNIDFSYKYKWSSSSLSSSSSYYVSALGYYIYPKIMENGALRNFTKADLIPVYDKCEPCPCGTYSNGGKIKECTSCPANKYQDATGSSSCKAVDAGYVRTTNMCSQVKTDEKCKRVSNAFVFYSRYTETTTVDGMCNADANRYYSGTKLNTTGDMYKLCQKISSTDKQLNVYKKYAIFADDGSLVYYGTDAILSGAKITRTETVGSASDVYSGGTVTVDGCTYPIQSYMYQHDPIILDLMGDGIKLTSAENGVMFDITATGQKLMTSWTDFQTEFDDAFLCLDKNKNGSIDDGSELFGDQQGATTGLNELAKYDDNKDGVIDKKDKIYPELLLWVDFNKNGISETGELRTLEQEGIVEISTSYHVEFENLVDEFGNSLEDKLAGLTNEEIVEQYRDKIQTDENGNVVGIKGTFKKVLSDGTTVIGKIVDAFFNVIHTIWDAITSVFE